ncbi:MAG: 7-cyano-7-deazaguanine synthase [Thermoproteota archaeon]|nr:7-cyano-7-deazaguanine synthase [Thermoproteota archaeon]
MRKTRNEIAICIISGGLDSLCVAAYLKECENYNIKTLAFSYGQRAMREITIAEKFSKMLNVEEHQTINMNFMKKLYGDSNALTNEGARLAQNFNYNIVVPIRNAIFITIAAAWAISCNARLIAYGAHSEDMRYPDCRPEFIESIAKSLNLAEADRIKLGLKGKICIWSPSLDGIGKSQLLKVGYEILGDLVFKSWSCYSNGLKIPGKGIVHCGRCESCINRKTAFSKAGIEDKTVYANNRK